MKIAILSRYQNKSNRGVETFVDELSSRLKKVHQVDVFAGEESDNINLVLRGGYDIVMPTNGRTQALKVSLGRLFSNYKLVIGGHSGIGRDDIFNIVVARPDVFVALTDYMAIWAKKWGKGIKIIKINNGVDLEKFTPTGDTVDLNLPKPIILSVGALVWYKHHELTINAVSKLEKKASLLIVGSGQEEEKLKKLAEEKIPGRYKICKFPYLDIPKVYRSADLFCLPSWDREAFGIVYLEAMASGLAVVAPDDKSRQEIVGQAGLLTDTLNTDKFSQAINQALNTKWAALPRKQAEKFSWEKVAKEYEECFLKLIS